MTWGALVGTAVGAGADFSPFDGTAVDAGAAGWGVEVAEEPQARIAATKELKALGLGIWGFLTSGSRWTNLQSVCVWDYV